MPTYEFRCPDGHTFDQFYRSISAAEMEAPCPQCGKPAQRQISGGAGLSFKGSGFYLTDYGKNAHRGGPSSKPADASSGSSGASGGESKPAGGESKPAASEGKPSTGGTSSGGGSSSGGTA